MAAAADLAPLESLLAGSFAQTYPKAKLKFVTGSSGSLTQQIENGAPYDVFLSANAQFVERLANTGQLRPDSVRAYAKGRLGVLWRDRKSHELKDLTRQEIRFLALPNPKLAPYGVAAEQALKSAGLWSKVQPKVVYGENVRQTLQLFESGNADAVITAASLLTDGKPELLPAKTHGPILQKAGALSTSHDPVSADAFLNFLTSPRAQKIFAKFGFASPRLIDEH